MQICFYEAAGALAGRERLHGSVGELSTFFIQIHLRAIDAILRIILCCYLIYILAADNILVLVDHHLMRQLLILQNFLLLGVLLPADDADADEDHGEDEAEDGDEHDVELRLRLVVPLHE